MSWAAKLAKPLKPRDHAELRTLADAEAENGVPGPADFMIRVLFLASEIAQPDGGKILDKLMELLDDIVQRDELEPRPIAFRHGKRKWKEEARQLECA